MSNEKLLSEMKVTSTEARSLANALVLRALIERLDREKPGLAERLQGDLKAICAEMPAETMAEISLRDGVERTAEAILWKEKPAKPAAKPKKSED